MDQYLCCKGIHTTGGYVHRPDCTLNPQRTTLTVTDGAPIWIPYVHVCCEHVNQWEARWDALKWRLKQRIDEHNDSVKYHRETGNFPVGDIQLGCATVTAEILISMEKMER